MLTLGLTGDVGAGKSTLCSVWRSMGISVFDADTVAREMWRSEDVQKKACFRWGDDFFDGEWKSVLKKIADKIFNSKEEYTVPFFPATEYWCDCCSVVSPAFPERVPTESTVIAFRSVSLTSLSK